MYLDCSPDEKADNNDSQYNGIEMPVEEPVVSDVPFFFSGEFNAHCAFDYLIDFVHPSLSAL